MNTPAKSQKWPPVSEERGSWAVDPYGGGLFRGAATPGNDDVVAGGIRSRNRNVGGQCTPTAEMGVTA